MRTLHEIVEAAKDGRYTAGEELLYAALALSALQYFDQHALFQLAHEPSRFRTPAREAAESFRRAKTALAKSPKEWVGWNNDPANPDYQRSRRTAKALADAVITRGEVLSAQQDTNDHWEEGR